MTGTAEAGGTGSPREVLQAMSWDLPMSSPGQAAAQCGDTCVIQPRQLSHVSDSGVHPRNNSTWSNSFSESTNAQ